MPIELKMPALSPTMEEGTLAKWLVKEGDTVKSGDLLAEIETDKATMEFEAVDEGVITKILVAEGTDEVKVGTVIALIGAEGEAAGAASAPPAPAKAAPAPEPVAKSGGETGAGQPATSAPAKPAAASAPAPQPRADTGDRIKASPLARRLAEQKGVDLASLTGSGPGGRIVKADIDGAPARRAPRGRAAPRLRPRQRLPQQRTPRSIPTSRTKRSSFPTCARRSRAA